MRKRIAYLKDLLNKEQEKLLRTEIRKDLCIERIISLKEAIAAEEKEYIRNADVQTPTKE